MEYRLKMIPTLPTMRIGWVGMMLTRCCGILEGMEGDAILDIYKLKLCLAQQQDDPDR